MGLNRYGQWTYDSDPASRWGHAPPPLRGVAFASLPQGLSTNWLPCTCPCGEWERASPAGLRLGGSDATLLSMKPFLIIVALLALTGCTASPQIRISPEGIGLQVVVCPDTGDCFVVNAAYVPEGWKVVGGAFASPVNGFQ